MRTTLDLDETLVTALLHHHPDLSKTEAIEVAIRSYLTDLAVERLRQRAGSMEIEDVSTELRARDRHA